MILAELMAKYKNCPVCGYFSLTTEFLSKSKPIIGYEEDYLYAIIDLRSLNKIGTDYKAGYFFSMKDDSFHIEFFTKHKEKLYNKIPLYILDNFKEFTRNASLPRFIRKCTSCHRFIMTSENLTLDFKSGKVKKLSLMHETFGFVTQTETDYKVVVLSNFYDTQMSKVFYWRQDNGIINYDYSFPINSSQLSLPLIPFVSEEKTRERLNGLLPFV